MASNLGPLAPTRVFGFEAILRQLVVESSGFP